MTKYLIYADGEKKPIRKCKHENEAIMFASDYKNLADYGCMSIVMDTDADGKYIWDPEAGAWKAMEDEAIGSTN